MSPILTVLEFYIKNELFLSVIHLILKLFLIQNAYIIQYFEFETEL